MATHVQDDTCVAALLTFTSAGGADVVLAVLDRATIELISR